MFQNYTWITSKEIKKRKFLYRIILFLFVWIKVHDMHEWTKLRGQDKRNKCKHAERPNTKHSTKRSMSYQRIPPSSPPRFNSRSIESLCNATRNKTDGQTVTYLSKLIIANNAFPRLKILISSHICKSVFSFRNRRNSLS